MATAAPLTLDTMVTEKKPRPPAASSGRRVGRLTPNDTQMCVRLPAAFIRTFKRAAFDANMSPGAYLIACYEASKKAGRVTA